MSHQTIQIYRARDITKDTFSANPIERYSIKDTKKQIPVQKIEYVQMDYNIIIPLIVLLSLIYISIPIVIGVYHFQIVSPFFIDVLQRIGTLFIILILVFGTIAFFGLFAVIFKHGHLKFAVFYFVAMIILIFVIFATMSFQLPHNYEIGKNCFVSKIVSENLDITRYQNVTVSYEDVNGKIQQNGFSCLVENENYDRFCQNKYVHKYLFEQSGDLEQSLQNFCARIERKDNKHIYQTNQNQIFEKCLYYNQSNKEQQLYNVILNYPQCYNDKNYFTLVFYYLAFVSMTLPLPVSIFINKKNKQKFEFVVLLLIQEFYSKTVFIEFKEMNKTQKMFQTYFLQQVTINKKKQLSKQEIQNLIQKYDYDKETNQSLSTLIKNLKQKIKKQIQNDSALELKETYQRSLERLKEKKQFYLLDEQIITNIQNQQKQQQQHNGVNQAQQNNSQIYRSILHNSVAVAVDISPLHRWHTVQLALWKQNQQILKLQMDQMQQILQFMPKVLQIGKQNFFDNGKKLQQQPSLQINIQNYQNNQLFCKTTEYDQIWINV